MGKRRVTLALDEDAAQLLDRLAAGPHKKSELLAALLRQAAAETSADEPLTEEDPLLRLEQRLQRIERKVELILNRLG